MDDSKKVEEVVRKIDNLGRNQCPNCYSNDYEVRNYDMMWHEGDMYCTKCGTYIRRFDAG